MAIGTDSLSTALFKKIEFAGMDNQAEGALGGLFAGHLAEQINLTEGNEARSEDSRGGRFADDIAAIKEKGLVSYIVEFNEKKMREEILEQLGLTEEDLAEMSPEQRADVEKMIDREIKKRLAAMSMMENDTSRNSVQSAGQNTLEEIMQGTGSGHLFISKMQEMENTSLFATPQREDEDKK